MSVEDDQAVRFVRLAHARARARGARGGMSVAPLDVAHEALRIWLESDRAGGTAASTVGWRVTDALRLLRGDSRKNGRALERIFDVRTFHFERWDSSRLVNLVELASHDDTPAHWVEAFEAIRDHGKPPAPRPEFASGSARDRVARWLKANGGQAATHAVIAAECGLARETVTRALRAAA